MNVEHIINSNSRKILYLYNEDFFNPYKVKAWQLIFNMEDCDLLMKKDATTFFKFNYEGINYLGEFIFDEIPQESGSCCFTKKAVSRHRLLFTKRPLELFATHIDKLSGYRTQYMVNN